VDRIWTEDLVHVLGCEVTPLRIYDIQAGCPILWVLPKDGHPPNRDLAQCKQLDLSALLSSATIAEAARPLCVGTAALRQ